MKKIIKKNLDELARIMPVLSEYEQQRFVGGKVVLMDENGYIIDLDKAEDSHYQEIRDLFTERNMSYSSYNMDAGTTYFMIASKNDLKIKDSSGTYLNNGYDTSINAEGDIEGNAITKDVFEFIARNTDVEWGYYSTSGGAYGRLVTSNSGTSVCVLNENEQVKYDSYYHSHPASVDHEPDKASEKDIEYANNLTKGGYEQIGIYDAKTGNYINYDEYTNKYE